MKLFFNNRADFSPLLNGKAYHLLPWRAGHHWNGNNSDAVYVLPGNEWEMLDAASQTHFTEQSYIISRHSDRMGYALQSGALSMVVTGRIDFNGGWLWYAAIIANRAAHAAGCRPSDNWWLPADSPCNPGTSS